jgi:hypothetical protein
MEQTGTEAQLDSLVDRSELRDYILLVESLRFGGNVVPAKSDQESPYVGDLPAESKRTSTIMTMPMYASGAVSRKLTRLE